MSERPCRLPSYEPCPCCQEDCALGTPKEPCWGRVMVWSDLADEERLHTCEGHSYGPVPYRPSTLPEDQIVPQESPCNPG